MIQFSKTAAAVSVLFCGVLTMFAGAQEPDEAPPRTRSRPPFERTAPPVPDERAMEPIPPADVDPPFPPSRHPARSGLSEETIRSLKEFPAGHEVEIDEIAHPPQEVVAAPEEALPAPRPSRPAPPPPSRSTPARALQRPEYVVEPPDMLLVEVLEALPGRPISGERLVRPDGRISLGFYGEVPVAGLTISEIKERVVLRMRRYLDDEILGLVQVDGNGEYCRDPRTHEVVFKDPRETDRVFVDVTAYNSQNYYILGEVSRPGRLPYTGGDTVLDLVQFAGGLLPTADKSKIRLIRSYPKGSPARVLPVDYEEIAMGTDSSTNYPILPNDRLVIPRLPSSRPEGDADRGASRQDEDAPDVRTAATPTPRLDRRAEQSGYFNRRSYAPGQGANAAIEKRIDELEQKLDRLIEAVEKSRARPGDESEPKPAADLPEGDPFRDGRPGAVDRDPFEGGPQRTERLKPPSDRSMEETVERPRPRTPRARRVAPARPRPPAAPREREEAPPGVSPR